MPRHQVVGIPGYKGYIPGKKADNVFGLPEPNANQKSNYIAKKNHEIRQQLTDQKNTHPNARNTIDPNTLGNIKTPELLLTQDTQLTKKGLTKIMDNHRVSSIPGYGGYIPSKLPETVVGKTFKHANEEAYHVRRENQFHKHIIESHKQQKQTQPTYYELCAHRKTQLW